MKISLSLILNGESLKDRYYFFVNILLTNIFLRALKIKSKQNKKKDSKKINFLFSFSKIIASKSS